MAADQALHDLSQEVSELSRILTNVQMDRDAYQMYARHLFWMLRAEGYEILRFDDYIEANNIPHPSRQP
jgi:hypothetical protein